MAQLVAHRLAVADIRLQTPPRGKLVLANFHKHQLDICCLQEIDIKTEVDKDLLSFKGYSLENESNDVVRRLLGT